ncbi:hypothetical protein [Burkholderia cenocepacia]|uniref:hypothetical protein n=1 Tax=Burkholderia cenocepacia TaxID=95486 RepID=UPI00190FE27A|nr:hypothetical protein [Burkholderia cenocepacia]
MNDNAQYQGCYRHTDGGIYRFSKLVWLASDGSRAIEYDHVWPFEQKSWVRVEAEWASRFTPVSDEEVSLATAGDRDQAQAVVNAAKKVRKEKERKAKHDKWRASWQWCLPGGIQVMPGAFTEQFLESSPEKVREQVEGGDLNLFAGCVGFGYIRFLEKAEHASGSV